MGHTYLVLFVAWLSFRACCRDPRWLICSDRVFQPQWPSLRSSFSSLRFWVRSELHRASSPYASGCTWSRTWTYHSYNRTWLSFVDGSHSIWWWLLAGYRGQPPRPLVCCSARPLGAQSAPGSSQVGSPVFNGARSCHRGTWSSGACITIECTRGRKSDRMEEKLVSCRYGCMAWSICHIQKFDPFFMSDTDL